MIWTLLLTDVNFMKLALEQARRAGSEVPVGAVLVNDGKVVARAFNQVERRHDASAHAEVLCLRRAASRKRNWRLVNCTLYCTLEPCAMCLSAAYAFRVQRIVYGAKDLRLGAVETWIRLPDHKHPFHTIDIQGGVCEHEAATLLKDFFKKRRRTTTKPWWRLFA